MKLTRTVHLRHDGTSLVLATDPSGLPTVPYWGADLGPLDEEALAALEDVIARMKVDNDPGLVTAPSILPAAWTGWSGRPGLVGRRADGTAWSPRLTVTRVVARNAEGGEEEVVEGTVRSLEGASLVVEMADAGAGLDLSVELDVAAGGVVQARATLTNEGEGEYALEELSLALPVPLEHDDVLDLTGRWGRERSPQRHRATFGTYLREGRHGRTGFDATGVLVCGQEGFDFRGGELRGLHVACPANHRTYLDRLPEGYQVLGGGELLMPGEVSLAPGESYTGPWLHFVHGAGLDEAAQRLHTWQRSLDTSPSPERPVTLNVWEAVYFDHSLPTLLRLADLAAKVGIERYVLDDGWFGSRRDDTSGLGDWVVSDEVWPDGLGPLVDHVTGLGMQFGLWFEPEMVNLDSDVARAHPEWIMAAGEELPLSWRHQYVLNLAIPEAWEHVHSQMDALLTEYPISYIKWDHNRDVFDGGDRTRGGRASVSAQTRAALALMDRLRADHPGLEIESCSSGGARIDLEMVRHTQRFWVSDDIDPHERQSIVRWTQQLIAPERLGTHVASHRSHTTGRQHDVSFRACTALWGHMGAEWDLTSVTQDELDALALWVDYYKKHRHTLLTGKVYRDEIGDATMWLHGVVAQDGSEGVFEVACLERSPLAHQGVLRLPGLESRSRYRVRPRVLGQAPSGLVAPPWFNDGEGVVVTGAVAGSVGLVAPALNPDQALLIEIERV